MKKNSVLGVGIFADVDEPEYMDLDSFESTTSFLDYSCIIISVENIVYYYFKSRAQFRGLECIDDENKSALIISDMKRRRKEVVELLDQGHNIFVILPSEQFIYIRSGKKEYSGTGRNRTTTNIVDLLNVLSFLPLDLKITKAVGKKIEFCNDEKYRLLKENMKSDFQYHSYIENSMGKPLMKIANTNKVISEVIEYSKGKIILLPFFAEEELYAEDENKWNQAIKKSLHTIINLDDLLKSNLESYTLPDWSEKFLVPQEKDVINKLSIFEKELEEHKLKIYCQKKELIEIQKIKIALTSSGDVLEEICRYIFIKLGFKELPVEDNRSDLVLKYGKKEVVVEIKGLLKSASEKNAAQLEKWVSEHLKEYGVQPKAILLINSFRDLELHKRVEPTFPNQMLKYAENREQCLMTTTQLVLLYYDCLLNKTEKNKRIKELLNTVGIYKGHQDFSKFINSVIEEDNLLIR